MANPVATGRKLISELLVGVEKMEEMFGIDYNFASVNAEGSDVTVEPIGVLLRWNNAASAFLPFTVNPDWAPSTAVTVGYTVKPITQNGLEYVCITAGTTNDSEGEPTWPTVPGATVTETDGVVWLARLPYGKDHTSPLPNQESLAIMVGAAPGIGFNKEDITLTSTSQKVTVLYRGHASIKDAGITWGAIAAADQTEVKAAFERNGIKIVTNATAVDPKFVV